MKKKNNWQQTFAVGFSNDRSGVALSGNKNPEAKQQRRGLLWIGGIAKCNHGNFLHTDSAVKEFAPCRVHIGRKANSISD